MKSTILVGYEVTDAAGNPVGPAKIVSGLPADNAEAQEQAAIFTAAKQKQKFPPGIRHLAFCTVETVDRAALVTPVEPLVSVKDVLSKAETIKPKPVKTPTPKN